MSLLSDFGQPIGDAFRMAARARGAWLITAILGLLQSIPVFFVASGAAPITFGMSSLIARFLGMFVQFWLMRTLGGPGLAKPHFWAWLGITLAMGMITNLANAFGSYLTNSSTEPALFASYLPVITLWVLPLLLFPLLLWATAFALGISTSLTPAIHLNGASFASTWVSFAAFSVVMQMLLYAIMGSTQTGSGLTNVIAHIASVGGSAIVALLQVAFLVASAQRIGGVRPNVTDVFS